MNQYLPPGYVVLSINYRSGIGYGLNFREAINYGAAVPSEFNDVEGAGLNLRTRADVDPGDRPVGAVVRRLPDRARTGACLQLFAAGVDFHGVHD